MRPLWSIAPPKPPTLSENSTFARPPAPKPVSGAPAPVSRNTQIAWVWVCVDGRVATLDEVFSARVGEPMAES